MQTVWSGTARLLHVSWSCGLAVCRLGLVPHNRDGIAKHPSMSVCFELTSLETLWFLQLPLTALGGAARVPLFCLPSSETCSWTVAGPSSTVISYGLGHSEVLCFCFLFLWIQRCELPHRCVSGDVRCRGEGWPLAVSSQARTHLMLYCTVMLMSRLTQAGRLISVIVNNAGGLLPLLSLCVDHLQSSHCWRVAPSDIL